MIWHRVRFPRKRISLPLLSVGLLLTIVLVALAAAPPNIDTFADIQTTVTATLGFPAGGVGSDAGAGNILGTQREAYAFVNSGPNSLELKFNGSTISINTGDNTLATTTLTYDGVTDSNPDPSSVDVDGLCTPTCADLTQGGTTNGFRITVPTDDTNGDLRVTVWDGTNGNSCTRLFVDLFPGLFPLGPAQVFYAEYPAINNCSGSVSFGQIGAVQFQVIGPALDMTIDSIDIGVFDWGDLPETSTCLTSPTAGYATTELCEGPRHAIPSGTLHLGPAIDPSPAPVSSGEFNGQPSVPANGDDINVADDEDGVIPVSANGSLPANWVAGTNGGSVRVTVQGSGYLLGWIDFDGDGFEPSELVVDAAVSTGTTDFDFTVQPPLGVGPATVYARFRLFGPTELGYYPLGKPYQFDGRDGFNVFTSALPPLVQAKDGEVEDYRWIFGPLSVTLADFSAVQVADHVLVTWETVSELNNRGFNLYRGTSPTEPDTQLNATLIPSQSQGSPGGFVYTWEDQANLVPGTTYYYWVEDVNLNNVPTRHGPVSVTFNVPTAVTLSGIEAGYEAGVSTLAWLVAALAGLMVTGYVIWRRRGAGA